MINLQEQLESYNLPGLYGNNKLYIFSDFHDIRKKLDEALYVDGVLLVMIKRGHAQLMVDGEQCDFYQGDLFCCLPNVVFESGMMSVDLEVWALCISPDYAFELVHKSGIDWPFTIMVQKHNCIKLSDEQSSQMQSYFSLLEYYINKPETSNKPKQIDTMMLLLVYTICDMIDAQGLPVHEQTFSPKDNLVERFFQIIKSADPMNGRGPFYKSVKDYAAQLNVTPKYLSMVCKSSLGKTAGEIIDDHVTSTAKILLHDNRYSIKQIADILGFANQSHFGTFFRRLTGMSPQQFRTE